MSRSAEHSRAASVEAGAKRSLWVPSTCCASILGLAFVFITSCHATVVEPRLAPAWAEAEAQKPLTRDDCIALATKSAPNAAAWQARRLAARAGLERAKTLPNPTLTLGWEDFGLNQAASGSSVQTTLSLAMALEDVFSRKRRKAAARHELEAEEADLRADAAKLAADVSRAYDELVAARTRSTLQDELTAVAEKQRADVERFTESGIAPHFDLERAEAELAQAQADRAKTAVEAQRLELELAFSLGFERPAALQLSEPLTNASKIASRDLTALLSAAANKRSEIAAAAARYQAELERLKLAAERLQFLPTVGAGPRKQGEELRGVATIDVALPIFDSGKATEHAQSATLLAAAAALRTSAHDVARDVCTALERLDASESYLTDHARDLAARRLSLRERTERLFRAGEAPYADLALARRDEVQARLALVDADLAAAAARIDLDFATGALELLGTKP